MNSWSEIVIQANRCRVCQAELLALGTSLPADDSDLDTLLEAVAKRHEPVALANLMQAALLAERAPDARHLTTAATEFEDIETIVTVAGHCQGDLPGAMLAAVRSGHLSWERETLAVFIAAWRCRQRNQAWPDGLIAEARVLARQVRTTEARGLLMGAAHILADGDLWDILDPRQTPLIRQTAAQTARNLAADLERPFRDSVPELAPPVVLQGGTIQRAVARVGRNEPCPCGSGKKYKKCCLEPDKKRLRDSSMVAGVTREELREAPEKYLTDDRLWEMRAHELTALDPARIPPELYRSYINRLNTFEEFEE